jgi:hypothetical protein
MIRNDNNRNSMSKDRYRLGMLRGVRSRRQGGSEKADGGLVEKVLEMAENAAGFTVGFSAFYVIVQDGLRRMIECVESERFLFVVEGRELESSLSEAVLISRRVYETLQLKFMGMFL